MVYSSIMSHQTTIFSSNRDFLEWWKWDVSEQPVSQIVGDVGVEVANQEEKR